MIKTINLVQKLVALLLMIVGMQFHAYAQSSPDDWTISTQVKKSDCQSDGSIKVINTKDDALFNHSYSLQENTPGGLKKEPQTTPVFDFLPAGTYTVTVTAQLKSDATQKFTRTLNNVVVPGDYKPLDATYNQERSRSTFVGSSTGSIVLNITNPKPGLVFKITNAPAGVTQGVIAATDNGDGTFKLNGDNYPAGNYEVQVSDNCLTRSVQFQIKEVAKLPDSEFKNYALLNTRFPNNTDQYDAANPLRYSCTSPVVFVRLSEQTRANKELMQLLKDGQFEIGMSPVDRDPAPGQFQTMSSKYDFYYALDISPTKLSDLYGPETPPKAKIVIRLKSDPTVKYEYTFHVPLPWITVSSWPKPVGCDKYTNAYGLHGGYGGMLCYPVKVNIREGSNTGAIIDTETFNDPTDKDLSSTKIFDYGKKYYLELVDANGLVVSTNDMIQNFRVDFKQPKMAECGTKYKDYFYVKAFDSCLPYDVEILEKETGKSVYKGTVTSAEGGESPALDFKKDYIYRITKGTITFDNDRWLNAPQITYQTHGGNSCKKDVGTFRFYFSYDNLKDKTLVLRQGTKELGRKTQTSWDYYFQDIYMPAGKYQMDVIEEGCPKKTIDIDWQGFFNHEEFTADLKQTCTGLEVTPRGQGTFNGKPYYTYYRIIGGDKDGYKDRVISIEDVKNGDKFTLTKEGTYLIGICFTATSGCFMDTIKVNYTYKNLKLASQHTSAYACGGGSTDGHILIKAEDGVAPYRYELWNEAKTAQIMGAGGTPLQPLEILSNGVAHFVHGVAGDTYSVKIIDACNNSFFQTVPIADLTSLTIASSESNVYCAGDPIQLQCLPLHKYKWYRPNAQPGDEPFSTEQNPIIPNARVEDSGLYKVVAEPLFCGKGIEGYVNITVHPCYAPVNPHLMNRVPR